jgi:mono/diheme cytochrome c family protein/plastocyanin
MKAERLARFFIIGILSGLPLAILIARWLSPGAASKQTVEMHARIAESGGWTPSDLAAEVGEPLHFRLTSDDVVHGFAIGQSNWPAVEINPGEVTETTITFEKPGKYVFYCTRWCGPSHWRMRGVIEVSGGKAVEQETEQPLYAVLGIDIDAPHPAAFIPLHRPSAHRGASLGTPLPQKFQDPEFLRRRSPSETWSIMRTDTFTQGLSDDQVWDLVALAWQSSTSPAALALGQQLYTQNCAACHGEAGSGEGVMATSISPEAQTSPESGHDHKSPANFTNPETMLGASPALLQGKIIRGGMGSGMPYWGPIFTEEQTWALVAYLWTFQFDFY